MKTAIALGTFDGLHSAHKAVLEKTLGFNSVAVTFEIPPKNVLSGKAQLLIMPNDRRIRIQQLGVNQVVMQNFNSVKNISAYDYLCNLKHNYNPSRIVCGFNYRFGKDALGDTSTLKEFCTQNKIELVVVPQMLENGYTVSSTHIRNLIANGEMAMASKAIYGGFGFTETVLHGDARGRQIGFPTANQPYPEILVQPKCGVYISRVTVDGKPYNAITNVGFRPTFKTEKISCETYIKDFTANIYGKEMKTELLSFIRPERTFSSLQELKNAILNDIGHLT